MFRHVRDLFHDNGLLNARFTWACGGLGRVHGDGVSARREHAPTNAYRTGTQGFRMVARARRGVKPNALRLKDPNRFFVWPHHHHGILPLYIRRDCPDPWDTLHICLYHAFP